MQITRKSMASGIKYTFDIPVTQEELDNWESGMLIQRAMPNLSADELEFIKTGITPEEWEIIFADEEEENGVR